MLETLVIALLSAASVEAVPTLPALLRPAEWLSAPVYHPIERSVDNWRQQSANNLSLSPVLALSLALGSDLPQTPRCVKLNNYWCVKRAGWSGEIAADAEGHVAFASAREGAAVAALLLRRYYVEYGRRSARAIVSRWAPAHCAPALNVARTSPDTTAPVAPLPPANPDRILPQRVVSMGLAPHGLQHTLRARWLAGRGRAGGAAAALAKPHRKRSTGHSNEIKVSDLMRAPSIAAGLGETASAAVADPAQVLADAPTKPLASMREERFELSPTAPIFSCASETARIANYAARVSEGVVKSADEDLMLFAADGTPTDNLSKVIANMAAVEIGPLRASDVLIRLAVAQLQASSKAETASR